MLSTVLGFNTAIIKQNDNFLALALKIKRSDKVIPPKNQCMHK
ncbi:Uncharacterised protein [Klebsiella pneumoniae]|nr:Uncharacterised protein [Klebsiella pneumoniae]